MMKEALETADNDVKVGRKIMQAARFTHNQAMMASSDKIDFIHSCV